jgi:5-methylcytosine-specific restriction endonuclease McrA
MKYSIGSITFKTKKASYEYVRDRVKSIALGDVAPEHQDYQFLCDLTKQTPATFKVELNECNHRLRQLLSDGVIVSWVKCSKFNFTKRSPELKLIEAMRNAIRGSVVAFAKVTESCCCQHCGSNTNLQVDHITPFSLIRKEFVDSLSSPVPTEFVDDKYYIGTFLDKDQSFKQAWVAYHDSKATFQYLCGSCNREKSDDC